MPWNIIPEFGGPPPFEDKIKWHGRDNYDFLLPDVDDPDVRTGKYISIYVCSVSQIEIECAYFSEFAHENVYYMGNYRENI